MISGHKKARLTVALLAMFDIFAWGGALVSALVLRFDFDFDQINVFNTAQLIFVVAILQLLAGWVFWLYRGRWVVGSFDEVRALVYASVCVMTVGWVAAFFIGYTNGIPRSTVVIAAPIAATLMGAIRYFTRLFTERSLKPDAESAEKVLIFGAGYVGETTVRRLMTDQKASYLPVGFLDDDNAKRNFDVRGVRVLGGLADLPAAVAKTNATKVIISIGDADSALMRKVHDIASALNVGVLVMPPVDKILQGGESVNNFRELSIEDLIGRTPVRLEQESIAKYLRDKIVLVTGAGGSIGSELCRQLTRFNPRELIMLDRDETSLQATQLSISGNGLLDSNEVVLADIRDETALRRIFTARKPDVVFHAAALKHLPMLEQYPDEAWKTNVEGTLHVLRAAQAANVKTFVNISTDKAANPTSVLGNSKRVAEKLTAWMSAHTGMRYLSVRFGNVIGSRGSMLPIFKQLIADGGPVTVTHPDVTRFFMTIPEACQLVIQAGGIGRPGEVLILDMGEPVRILDVAKRMIAQSGKDIEIVYTGLRHGEKLHEELVGEGETDERPFHPKISHAVVSPLDPENLDHIEWLSRMDLRDSASKYTDLVETDK